MAAKTLFQKVWDAHVVRPSMNDIVLLYIDRHLVHEVTSPQAFAGLRAARLGVHSPELTIATMDHNVPTRTRDIANATPDSVKQVTDLARNCAEFGVRLYDLQSPDQGIIHVIAPEQGLILPGTTVVCGDSHTGTHGAFGALAFGIGTSEVEHVLATQTLQQHQPKSMLIEVNGPTPGNVAAKDIILYIIGEIGTAGGTGYAIEYAGQAIRDLDMDGRMTVCNMSVEAGAKAGMIAPDDTTFNYLVGRRFAPGSQQWVAAESYWRTLPTDEGAAFDKTVRLDATKITPMVTWGTNPEQVVGVNGVVPHPDSFADPIKRSAAEKALKYMGLIPGTRITDLPIDKVFIGSCTNGRLSDLQEAAAIVEGKRVHPNVAAMVVPGSEWVRRQAEAHGLDKVFKEAGFEWRFAGCSACLAMNEDKYAPGERVASTSNRNFEGRQGLGARTHLVSARMAAAAAIAGKFVNMEGI